MDYSWWSCNTTEEETCKILFSLSVKVLNNNRYIKMTGVDFNTLSQTVDRKTKTQQRTPADMGAV